MWIKKSLQDADEVVEYRVVSKRITKPESQFSQPDKGEETL